MRTQTRRGVDTRCGRLTVSSVVVVDRVDRARDDQCCARRAHIRKTRVNNVRANGRTRDARRAAAKLKMLSRGLQMSEEFLQ